MYGKLFLFFDSFASLLKKIIVTICDSNIVHSRVFFFQKKIFQRLIFYFNI